MTRNLPTAHGECRCPSGAFNSSVAATVAELAASPLTRHELIYLGGGRLVDWLLQLAYPQQGEDSDWPYNSHDSGGLDSVDVDGDNGRATDGAGHGPDDWDDVSSWFGSLPLPPAFKRLSTGGSGLAGDRVGGGGKLPAERSPPLPPLVLPPLPLPGRRAAASDTHAGSRASSSSSSAAATFSEGDVLTGQPAPGGSRTQPPPGGHVDGEHLRMYDLQLAAALASADSQEPMSAGSGGGGGSAAAAQPTRGAHGSAQVPSAGAGAAAAAAPSEPWPEAVLTEDERRARRAERALEALLMDGASASADSQTRLGRRFAFGIRSTFVQQTRIFCATAQECLQKVLRQIAVPVSVPWSAVRTMHSHSHAHSPAHYIGTFYAVQMDCVVWS